MQVRLLYKCTEGGELDSMPSMEWDYPARERRSVRLGTLHMRNGNAVCMRHQPPLKAPL